MFADEFEEFRARSYSGGFSARRHARPTHHRSRTTDPLCLSSTACEPTFSGTPFQNLQLEAPMSAPIRWASQETSAGRFRQITSVSRNRDGLSSRLVEVTVTRRNEDANGNWRPGEMRPRLNSAPQRRPNLSTPQRRQALVAGDTPSTDRHSPDQTSLSFSYPMRKIRSFIGLGRKCLLGDEDLHAVDLFKDYGSTNGNSHHHHHLLHIHHHNFHHHHRLWKAADDLRCQKPTSNFRFVKRPEPFVWCTAAKPDVGRNILVKSAQREDGEEEEEERDVPDEYYRILFTGRRGVGKATIVERLLNKKSIGFNKEFHSDYDAESASCCPRQRSPSPLIIGGEEGNVVLNDLTGTEANGVLTSDDDVTGIVIVYSVEDRKSYELAIDRLYELRNDEVCHQVAIILVANKVDLVRTRVISEQEGKSTAKTYDCKYIEVSAAIDHQIDDLFVGVLHQVRLVSLQRRQQHAITRSAICSPMRTTPRRWTPLERNESLDHRQNSDTCCLLAAREKVLAKLFTGQRRASKSCINLFEI